MIIQSRMFCTYCGKEGLPVWRLPSKKRPAQHLKKLWCPHCKCERNHIEIGFNSSYTKDDFNLDFRMGTFKESPTLIVMVGLPGAGKSTFTRQFPNHIVVSRDSIRFGKIKGEDSYFAHEKEVYKEFVDQIKGYLLHGRNVIADATHLTKKSRARLLQEIGMEDITKVAVFVDVPLETCIERNNGRKSVHKVPEEAIRKMSTQLEEPTLDEGFDNIVKIGE